MSNYEKLNNPLYKDSVGTVINIDTVKRGFDWLMELNDYHPEWENE